MDIKVEYKDKQGKVTNPKYSLSGLAFVKHLACAGMHYAPRAQKLLRIIGMFLHYNPYMQRQAFYNNLQLVFQIQQRKGSFLILQVRQLLISCLKRLIVVYTR